ncbi:MAG: sodium:solute symporter family protein [Deltaproteobacteria bacterium]|jgi:SSS family solute:Na+ symporter|nr:sodium:solute symporter family protein [Deltaproteobacteria bacterium]
MTLAHYSGIFLVLFLITALGLYSGSRVKSAGDFSSGGRKAGAGLVAGAVIGTLAGGASTIGTAQLAFIHGFSAWWFTLGGGLGCLILAICYAKALHTSGVSTLPQMLAAEYGRKVATAASLLTSLGSFLSIVSQVLSAIALITSVSGLSSLPATLIAVLLMTCYVMFGGIFGAGIVGMAKTLLLFSLTVVCGLMALYLQGGWSSLASALPPEGSFGLTARGLPVDVGAGLSLVLGVITTQAYIQAVISARTLRLAKSGLFLSAALIPVIGIAGILVGLYMRVHMPDINPAGALPVFVLEHMPPLVAGMALGTLLITVAGSAAGVALGLSSMFCADIYRVYFNPAARDKTLLFVSRAAIACIFAAAALISAGNMGSLILGWSFMSMGLRGAVAFGALTAAVYIPGRVSASCALCSMFVGPLCILLGKPFIGGLLDPLFPGVAGSLIVLLIGYFRGVRRNA